MFKNAASFATVPPISQRLAEQEERRRKVRERRLKEEAQRSGCLSARVANTDAFRSVPLRTYAKVMNRMILEPPDSSIKIKPKNILAATGLIFGLGLKTVARQIELSMGNALNQISENVSQRINPIPQTRTIIQANHA